VLIGAGAIEQFYAERRVRMVDENEFSHITTIALQLPDRYPFYESAASFDAFGQLIVKHVFDTRGVFCSVLFVFVLCCLFIMLLFL
jgi:hypothetical protein